MIIDVDPTDLKPGDVVVAINDYEQHGCHCDVFVTVRRDESEEET